MILLGVADVALAVYLLRLGTKGMLGAEGTGEGWVATIVAGAGVATGLAAIAALFWSSRANGFSPKGYAIRLVIAAVVAGLPWVVVATFMWPAEWRFPRRVPTVCFNVDSTDRMREVGKLVDGVLVMDNVFEPLVREVSRDFVYVVPNANGKEAEFPMDCSSHRCRPKTGSEDALLRALRALPPCPK